MATRQEAQTFLDQFKTAVDFGARVRFRETQKNIQGLADLGELTQNEAIQYVLRLTGDCYAKGPEPDRDEDNKEIWVFGCSVNDTEVYVKLRLDPNSPFSNPVVRSFHPAEHPLAYPHRKGGGE